MRRIWYALFIFYSCCRFNTFIHTCKNNSDPRKGYNTDKIKANAPKEWSDTLEEYTYLVPMVTVNEREVHSMCEKELAQAEMNLKKKKQLKDDKSNAASASQPQDALMDLETDSENSEKEREKREKNQSKKAKAAAKALARKEQKEAEKEEKKKSKEVQTKNKKIMKLAAETMPLFGSVVEELEKALENKKGDASVAASIKDDAIEVLQKIKGWKGECALVLKEAGKDTNKALDLPFSTSKEAQETIKTAKSLKDKVLGKKPKKEK